MKNLSQHDAGGMRCLRKRFGGIGWLGSLCAMMLAGVMGLRWLQVGDDAVYPPCKPKSLVTTFKGDGRISRAFTWYSGSAASLEGELQIAQGMMPGSWKEAMH